MTLAKSPAGKDILPDNIASKVMETTPVLMRFIRKKMRERPGSNTSVPQIRVMAFIESHPGCSLTPLSEYLGITSASASSMINRLVRAGLVDRVTDPSSRRNVVLHLTALGKKDLRSARQVAVTALSHQLSKLDATQLKHMEESVGLLKTLFSTVYGELELLSQPINKASENRLERSKGTA